MSQRHEHNPTLLPSGVCCACFAQMEVQHAAFKHHTARKMGQKGIALGFKWVGSNCGQKPTSSSSRVQSPACLHKHANST